MKKATVCSPEGGRIAKISGILWLASCMLTFAGSILGCVFHFRAVFYCIVLFFDAVRCCQFPLVAIYFCFCGMSLRMCCARDFIPVTFRKQKSTLYLRTLYFPYSRLTLFQGSQWCESFLCEIHSDTDKYEIIDMALKGEFHTKCFIANYSAVLQYVL